MPGPGLRPRLLALMAPDLADLARQVRRTLRPDGDTLIPYETGPRGRTGRAAFAVVPSGLDELRAALRWAYEHRVPLVPRGAGHTAAAVPDAFGTQGVLDLAALSEPPVVDAVAGTVTAGAGVPLAALDDALRSRGLTLPFGAPGDRTVGGLIGDGASGRRVVPGGGLRSSLLGVAAVLADAGATPLPLTDRPAAGGDPSLFFVGAQGSLGVVTAARFTAVPRPLATAAAILTFPDDEAALALFDALHRAAPHLLTGFELASPGLAEAPRPSALIRLADVWGELPVPIGTLLTTLVTAHAGAADIAWLGDGDPEPPWPAPDHVTAHLSRTGTVIELDVTVPRERVTRLRADARSLAASVQPGARIIDIGDALDGRWRLYVTWPSGRPEPTLERLTSLVVRLHDVVVYAHQGTVAAVSGVGFGNRGFHQRVLPPAAGRAAGRVKDAFDPRGLLGAPRFGPLTVPA